MDNKKIIYKDGIAHPKYFNQGEVVTVKYKSSDMKYMEKYGRFHSFISNDHFDILILNDYIDGNIRYGIKKIHCIGLKENNAEVWIADQEEIETYNKLYDSAQKWEKEILKTPSEDQTQLADRPETEYKNDKLDDKLRWDLLPMSEIEDIVKLYHRGAKKYKPDSWKQLNDGFNRYRAALMRHMMAYLNGERYDKETGSNHLTAVAWNAIAMLWFDKHGKGLIPLDKPEDTKPEDTDHKDDDDQESYGCFSGSTFVLNDELNDKFIQKLKEILPIAKKTRVCDFKALYADVFDDDFIKEHDFVVIDFTDKNIPPATHIKLKWVTINNGLFPSAEFNNSYNERVAAFINKNEDGDYIVTCLTQGGRKKA